MGGIKSSFRDLARQVLMQPSLLIIIRMAMMMKTPTTTTRQRDGDRDAGREKERVGKSDEV